MTLPPPPLAAAWLHQEARSGFEVVFIRPQEAGYELNGCTTAVEGGNSWIVSYDIRVDRSWVTRQAKIIRVSSAGPHETLLQADGRGHWEVDGEPAPLLDGCLDIDLESSVVTNTLPIHRLALTVGERRAPAAAYVRAATLRIDRLEQEYARLEDQGTRMRYGYKAPSFDFSCQLTLDPKGFVIEYPGIARRAL